VRSTSRVARPTSRDASDVRRHVFCAMDGDYARTPHVAWQTALARDARTVFRTNSMLALGEAVRSGAGLATLPCALVDALLARVKPLFAGA
jgi:DNA-binding transcriptional LysR family regulator